MNRISDKAIIHPNVQLGDSCIVEDYAIIGAPLKGDDPFPPTIIGDNATIRSHTVIYAGNRIGKNFQTGNKANIRELNDIGDDVSIGTLSVVEHHVKIGKGSRIHTQVFIPEYSVLEERAWLGPNVVLTNARYPMTRLTKSELKGPVIKEGGKVGANSTVLPGVIIGKGSLIGAGSLVANDTLPLGIYFGTPAVRRGWICTCGIRLESEKDREYTCSDCDKVYTEEEGVLKWI
jgi:acetyltransferase-like isoleucine patch superfamily enzyme